MQPRQLCRTFLLALVPAICLTQQPTAKPPVLHSKAYRFEDLTMKPGGPNGTIKMWSVFDGVTTRGELLEMHLSELAPGGVPNPIHPHHNEEILVMREGTLAVTINDTTTVMGPGSVAYVQSEDKIGTKLVGNKPAKYVIFSVGDR